MAFKKSNSSAGEEFAARKRPALGPNDQIDVNDIETLKYYQGVKRARNMGLMA